MRRTWTLLIVLALTCCLHAATLRSELLRLEDTSQRQVLVLSKLEGRTNCLTLEIVKGKAVIGQLEFFQRSKVRELIEELKGAIVASSTPHPEWSVGPDKRGDVKITFSQHSKPNSVVLIPQDADRLAIALERSLSGLRR